MHGLASRLTYANVVATIALFLALGGGAVWAAGEIGSGDIAPKAVRARNLAPGSVTGGKVRPHSLGRAGFREGALPGLPVADLRGVARNLDPSREIPAAGPNGIPLGLMASFVPKPDPFGKAKPHPTYLLQEEISGTVVDADGPGPGSCRPAIEVWDNGREVARATLVADAALAAQRQANVADDSSPIALTAAAGEKQTISLQLFPDPGCATGSRIKRMRAVVIELG
jgi:hypothetical protein